MKKLDLLNEVNGLCPKCSHPLTFDCDYRKAKSWRVILGIILLLAIPCIIGNLVMLIFLDNAILDPKLWINFSLSIVLTTILCKLFSKIKDFEMLPHRLAYCEHCRIEWIVD